ncbi:MAG: type II toxin-antitoxin system VapC family toxin [bacterium]
MIVVDTNIISYLFIPGQQTEVVKQILTKDSDWIAPILWRSEFRSVLSLYIRKKHLTVQQAKFLIQEAEDMMVDSEYEVNSGNVLELVNKSKCSSCDCEFIALAEDIDVPLVTRDKKILSEFPSKAISAEEFLLIS